ncbi:MULTISPECIES: acyl carrier protein [Eubacterium]|uniref:Acyl carrier protein n=1 Tax=Eubacterium barkeri TaxID=1528 RepID=A0A1H3GEA2_EUBBA|nr:acyl carrier protein [Eubacterium barkeri]SDY01653.1 Acyl carrier protein [Eubacterium barkeri]
MANKDLYFQIFQEVFYEEVGRFTTSFKRESEDKWDSLAHITLISELEDKFEILLNSDDILKLNSFEMGIEILKNYGIIF